MTCQCFETCKMIQHDLTLKPGFMVGSVSICFIFGGMVRLYHVLPSVMVHPLKFVINWRNTSVASTPMKHVAHVWIIFPTKAFFLGQGEGSVKEESAVAEATIIYNYICITTVGQFDRSHNNVLETKNQIWLITTDTMYIVHWFIPCVSNSLLVKKGFVHVPPNHWTVKPPKTNAHRLGGKSCSNDIKIAAKVSVFFFGCCLLNTPSSDI